MQNNINTLRSVFTEHTGKVSDKWSIYLDEYNRLFVPYREQPVHLLEIGIQNGGSLEVWSKFFSNSAKLVGCDINPLCAQLQFDDPKITIVVADANTDEAEQNILAASLCFDIIIDDGSHHSGDIVRSFSRYFTHLSDGGLYVAEDIHCSYWKDCEGGIFHPHSSMAFFKRLADITNHEHWGTDKTRCELLKSFSHKYAIALDESSLAHIHSIEFINSMCVIRKASIDDNIIGSRLVVGTDALVCSDIMPFHGSGNLSSCQNDNIWSTGASSVEEELVVRLEEIASLALILGARNMEISRLNLTAAELEMAHLAQLASVRQQLEVKTLELAERENTYSLQLQDILQTHELQIAELVPPAEVNLHTLQDSSGIPIAV